MPAFSAELFQLLPRQLEEARLIRAPSRHDGSSVPNVTDKSSHAYWELVDAPRASRNDIPQPILALHTRQDSAAAVELSGKALQCPSFGGLSSVDTG